MNRILIFTILICLLGLNAYLVFQVQKNRAERHVFLAKAEQVMSLSKKQMQTFEHNLKINAQNPSLSGESVELIDSLGQRCTLYSIFEKSGEYKLVCRFSQSHCESCIRSMMSVLSEQVDSIGIENVLFVGNHRNHILFERAFKLYEINATHLFNSERLPLPMESAGYPYFFILDKDMNVSNIFFPTKGVPEPTRVYLESVKELFDMQNSPVYD